MISLKIIKTQEQYQKALQQLEKLFDAKPNTTKWEELELLAILIEDYEKKNISIDAPDPIEAIRFRMDQQWLSVNDLWTILWYKSRASEILHRKRKLSIAMIRKISDKLKISPEILIQAY